MDDMDEGFEAAEVQGCVLDYPGARDGMDYQLLTLSFNTVCIHDPRLNDNGFGSADPSEYGMTEEEVTLFVKTNEALIRAQNELYDRMADQIDSGCLRIQEALGVPSGDFAGQYFESGEAGAAAQIAKLSRDFAQYAVHEYKTIVEELREQNRIAPK